MNFKFYTILWIIIMSNALVPCLRLTILSVPNELIVGESSWLNCTYDLENDHLYSIQWYKIINNKPIEFYRYMPEQYPSITIYEMPGIFIDENKSKTGNVYLNRSDLNTQGIYRCEVSADSPSFQTVRKQVEMRVFQLPQLGPIIKQLSTNSNTLNQLISCSTYDSKPSTILNWFINDYPLNKFLEYGAKILNTSTISRNYSIKFNLNTNQLDNYENQNSDLHYLFNSSSLIWLDINLILDRLNFLELTVLEDNLFNTINLNDKNLNNNINNQKPVFNQIKVSCKAQITNHLDQTSEVKIMETGDHLISVHDSNENGPIITGLLAQYKKGDLLQLNCTSTKSKSAAELTWKLNDKHALQYKNTLVKHFRPIKLNDNYIIWRSSLTVVLNDALLNNLNNFSSRTRLSGSNKFERSKHVRIKCFLNLDKIINVGTAVYTIDLLNEINKDSHKQSLPARHNRSTNIIWPIFTGEIIIGLFIVSMVICVIRSMCAKT